MGRENTIVTGAAIPKRSMSSSVNRSSRKQTDDKKFVRVVAVDPNSRVIWYEQTINNYAPTGAPVDMNVTGSQLSIEELNNQYPKALPEDASQTRLPIINEWVELKSVPDYTSGIRNGQYNRVTVYKTSPINTQFNTNDNRVPQANAYKKADPDNINQNLNRVNYINNNIGV